jgi:hypothetical protein
LDVSSPEGKLAPPIRHGLVRESIILIGLDQLSMRFDRGKAIIAGMCNEDPSLHYGLQVR